MLKRLWADEGGAILSAELILIMTILVIGMIVGLKTLQDAVLTELADVAAAIGSLNQSYSFSGATGCTEAVAWTAGSTYIDVADMCDLAGNAQGAQGVQVAIVTGNGAPVAFEGGTPGGGGGPPIIP